MRPAHHSIAPDLRVRHDWREALLLALICACFALQALLIFRLPANWDEFRFLADVHLLARGELTESVQTFHAHFFTWLLARPGHELDQIIAARGVMLAFEAMTGWMLYRCARVFAPHRPALLAVLTYLTFVFVLKHGMSFRFDPPSTMLMMAATTLLLTATIRLPQVALVGVLSALGALVTIKAVFFLPTMAAIAWWRYSTSPDKRATLFVLLAGAAIGAGALVAMFLFHQAHVAAVGVDAARDIVASSMTKTLGQQSFLPRLETLLQSMANSPLNWLMVIAGTILAWLGVWSPLDGQRAKAIALAGFALPLLTLLLYRNAFAYYYAFMLAPVSVTVVLAAERAVKRFDTAFLGGALFVGAMLHYPFAASPVLQSQRAVLDAVHAIFPQPVAYIDRSSMVGAFPKQGWFMSTWGTEVYRDAGKPIMHRIMTEKQPAFVLINSSILEYALPGNGVDRRMLPEDIATLRANFVPHWGPIWVAGKHLLKTGGSESFEMLVAGRYTIESTEPVLIDGARLAPGAIVSLRAGMHRAEGARPLTLRFGDHLPRPDAPPPRGELFIGF